ncbi:exopolysaccharide biosynthesis protein [Opitutus terrae]|uniref:Exopolysaccharide synthesis ExoD n=1 Tax=Opitutus terrae (strain DSM 11246 / JCM 15787 / PB90-1) TaxID=452637 RepID=B1ZWM4_OPITP|nr:exopolysaccharide biosynthesis protein [Opitutus terrae]ACB74151.1 Exopolysaccharide synthesis ExoD [Opitutus terrae PB90-1]
MATNAAPEPAGSSHRPPGLSAQALVVQPGPPRKLSEDLTVLLREFEVETVTLREVMAVMHGRGYLLLVILLALPFATPIPLPGLSTPFGSIIALLGTRLALGKKPWLPAKLLDVRLAPRLFAKVFAAARAILRGFEYFLRPRLPAFTATAIAQQLHAVSILFAALLLLLPLPLPFSNTLPAFSILFLAAGLVERDGVFLLAGHIALVLALAYIILAGIAGVEGVEAIWHWLRG